MYEKMRNKFKEIIKQYKLENSPVKVKAKVLSKKEALGDPIHDDYPLLKGKESLMEADFLGSKGVAYSDMCADFEGSLDDVVNIDLSNNYYRAVFIATINAVLKHLGLIELTEHCRDNGPVDCANHLKTFFNEKYLNKKILLIGFQPRFAEALTERFNTKIVDLNPDNIGKKANGVRVEPEEMTDKLISQSDLLFVTSSTFINGTVSKFIIPGKKTIFYGVSGAGPTFLLNLERYCHQ